MSVKPRTALTGVPSGAVTVSGTPKKARKYRLAESNSTSIGAAYGGAGEELTYPHVYCSRGPPSPRDRGHRRVGPRRAAHHAGRGPALSTGRSGRPARLPERTADVPRATHARRARAGGAEAGATGLRAQPA